MEDLSKDLSLLGSKSELPSGPDAAKLETIQLSKLANYTVRMSCPEFTSLCPKTGQPDFAHIVLDYMPGWHLIESKALKLFMASFRNHGAFHEQVTQYIGERLCDLLNPQWLRIAAFWYPRGGIPIDIFFQYGDLPASAFMMPLDIPSYKGR